MRGVMWAGSQECDVRDFEGIVRVLSRRSRVRVAPYCSVGQWLALCGEEESGQGIRGPVQKPSRQAVVLGEGDPFPVIGRQGAQIGSRPFLEVVEKRFFVRGGRPETSSVVHELLPLDLRFQIPPGIALPSIQPERLVLQKVVGGDLHKVPKQQNPVIVQFAD